jgi:Uma2 family endonuclease
MTIAKSLSLLSLPDHRQLPESDGTFVKNFQEHPQSLLLTSSIMPVLDRLHPDGRYAIGQDSGIYWRLVDPPERGAEAPDWFYVANVAPSLDGTYRRSYVMWKELVIPTIAIEIVSGDGSEERDDTAPIGDAKAGKFWVYEQAIQIPFYAIYEAKQAAVEVYELVSGKYQRVMANQRGHYPITFGASGAIAPMGVELGIWQGEYLNQDFPWLRWWDDAGNLLLAGDELAKQESLRADEAFQQVEEERQRAAQESLRANEACRQVEEERQRAEQESLRADEAFQQVEEERQRAEQESLRADEVFRQMEEEKQRSVSLENQRDRLAAKLRELGIDPEDA